MIVLSFSIFSFRLFTNCISLLFWKIIYSFKLDCSAYEIIKSIFSVLQFNILLSNEISKSFLILYNNFSIQTSRHNDFCKTKWNSFFFSIFFISLFSSKFKFVSKSFWISFWSFKVKINFLALLNNSFWSTEFFLYNNMNNLVNSSLFPSVTFSNCIDFKICARIFIVNIFSASIDKDFWIFKIAFSYL